MGHLITDADLFKKLVNCLISIGPRLFSVNILYNSVSMNNPRITTALWLYSLQLKPNSRNAFRPELHGSTVSIKAVLWPWYNHPYLSYSTPISSQNCLLENTVGLSYLIIQSMFGTSVVITGGCLFSQSRGCTLLRHSLNTYINPRFIICRLIFFLDVYVRALPRVLYSSH
jgi:hypothetical protein